MDKKKKRLTITLDDNTYAEIMHIKGKYIETLKEYVSAKKIAETLIKLGLRNDTFTIIEEIDKEMSKKEVEK